jgi:hypothetical protein
VYLPEPRNNRGGNASPSTAKNIAFKVPAALAVTNWWPGRFAAAAYAQITLLTTLEVSEWFDTRLSLFRKEVFMDHNTGKPDPKVPQGRTVSPQTGGVPAEGNGWNFPVDHEPIKLPGGMLGGIPHDAGTHRFEGNLGEAARATKAREQHITLPAVGPNKLDDKERRSH